MPENFSDKAGEISAFLGYGGCEIFPKQEQILVERGDVGNFINLPYFDHEQTTSAMRSRKMVEDATLEEFVELVEEAQPVHPNEFVNTNAWQQALMSSTSTHPCLQGHVL